MRKYSSIVWVGIKPESNGEIITTVRTDRKSEYVKRMVVSSLASFRKCNFSRFSFATNRMPQMHRLKVKAKKFVFYKLIFRSISKDTTATLLSTDIRVRSTGYAK